MSTLSGISLDCRRPTRVCSVSSSTRTVACRSTPRTSSQSTRANDVPRCRPICSPSPTPLTATCSSVCNGVAFKLEFHGTDTDTDILADFRARIVARMSACPATSPFSLPTSRTRTTILAELSADLSVTRAFPRDVLARMSVRNARVYTCKRVLYTISYRVHVYKITR